MRIVKAVLLTFTIMFILTLVLGVIGALITKDQYEVVTQTYTTPYGTVGSCTYKVNKRTGDHRLINGDMRYCH